MVTRLRTRKDLSPEGRVKTERGNLTQNAGKRVIIDMVVPLTLSDELHFLTFSCVLKTSNIFTTTFHYCKVLNFLETTFYWNIKISCPFLYDFNMCLIRLSPFPFPCTCLLPHKKFSHFAFQLYFHYKEEQTVFHI